ncbi:protein SIEVE ELEMENT OCCLUSION B-like isoform X6 [Diospyros lotus]|uniref:protein SIEVE ELEMENT OCCLUSION B-like isoform X4 n=1 Tax=Diospyros lotus TaxID=55363 RepID=UPI0022570ACA|nr:protein SIEVE ELEMENT OCCLUSION B-like isoform X4 [Diospyros lotus]XP_052197897.1 protein SIEVE ELEMENT OCCLUSION B-like isoform X5 [Diospyros lotus]XP_052197898.1 protein SIEVE ELEMENT OCCLUSION B-like isoform X6 [Diospyros lotus]
MASKLTPVQAPLNRNDPQLIGNDPQLTRSDQQLIRTDPQMIRTDPQLTPNDSQITRSDPQLIRTDPQMMRADPQPMITANPPQLLRSSAPLMVNPSKYIPAAAASAQQLAMRGTGDRSMFLASEDSYTMKQIQEIHRPDGREIDVKPLFQLVEDIVSRASMFPTQEMIVPGMDRSQVEQVEDKSNQAVVISMLEGLAYVVDRISIQIAFNSFSGIDGHETTVSLLKMLASYPWDAKLVLTLAAFALNYGEFWLLAQIYSSNQLARSVAILRQLPVIMEHSGTLKPRLDALNVLIKAILNLARVVSAFKGLPPTYITQDVPAMSAAMATMPTAVYWSIRSIIACAAQIASLSSMGHEFLVTTTESWELSTLAHKINNIHDHLQKLLDICYSLMEEKRDAEAFESLVHILDMIHIDNMRVLKALIYTKDDILPLYDGSAKRRVSLEVLRRKNVLLLISGLGISQDELSILEQIYRESRTHAVRMDTLYEVVWIPIVDPSLQGTDFIQKFESLQSTMPWYTVHHPSIIDRAVIRFVREKWHFRNKPILVVLDPQGKVVSPNAIHMMWIWGSNAFPFTSFREEVLWKEETWRLELLVDGIDQTILDWIKEGKYVFMYGGDDIEWIRRFTTRAKAVAKTVGIPLEMVYVGKSHKKEPVRRVTTIIEAENLSYAWQELMVWFFWTRLESMLFSKIQLGKVDEHDQMMQEIKKLLSYDKSGGWAVLSRGSEVVVNGHFTTMMSTVVDFDKWKDRVELDGFPTSFKGYHNKLLMDTHPCSRFEFPITAGRIPDNLKCPECQRFMEKFLTFICCHDEDAIAALY